MSLSFLWTSVNALFGWTWPYSFLLLFVFLFCYPPSLIEEEIEKRVLVHVPCSLILRNKQSGRASSAVAATSVPVVVPDRVLQGSLDPHL